MENWKDVKGFEEMYQVSNLGRVKSFKCNKEKILKPSINGAGYLSLSLFKDGRDYTKRVHILVAEAFLEHIPDNTFTIVVDHKDGNILNNEEDNLQLITQRRNTIKGNVVNKSSLLGTSWSSKDKVWISQIYYKKNIRLGCFNNEQEAHQLYIKALKDIENNTFNFDQYMIERKVRNKQKRLSK
jgi:hypothetical protein